LLVPIQGFLSLTNQLNNKHGGLQIVKGFHKKYTNHEEIMNMNLKNNSYLLEKIENVCVKAGSLVLWDYRLPHKTNSKFVSDDTREVIYMSYIPNTKENKSYCKNQYVNFLLNLPPPDFYNEKSKNNKIDYEYTKELSNNAEKQYKK
jgi:hypothetical protein